MVWYIPLLYCIMVLMENTIQIKTDLPVLERNEELFETYALWRSLPIPILKQMTVDQIKEKMGFDEDDILELVAIHTQEQFAEKYGLEKNTLGRWNKILRERDPLFEAKGWARGLAKNVVLSMYNHAIRKGNPLLMKLFFQIVNDWEESSKIKFAPGDIEFHIDLMPKKPEEIKTPVKPKKIKDVNKTNTQKDK